MLRIATALTALLLLAAPAHAVCFGDNDGGEISFFCRGKLVGALRADGFGGVKGKIEGVRFSSYYEGRGEARGRINGRPVRIYDDGFGDVTISSRRGAITCRDDGFGGQDCK